MFIPIHSLPQFDGEEATRFRDRWQKVENQGQTDCVLKHIREGAGSDFLQWRFEEGHLPILEHMSDLRGIQIHGEKIRFPTGDNFKGIDFSYAQIFNSSLENAAFVNGRASFSDLCNVTFDRCVFAFQTFYGSKFENVTFLNCDFVEHDGFINDEFRSSRFIDCFFCRRIFFDCRFDENTEVGPISNTANLMKKHEGEYSNKELPDIFRGIQDAYSAGGVIDHAREYLFRYKQAARKYLKKTSLERFKSLVVELLTGYGLRPLRIVVSMVLAFGIFTAIFSLRFGFSDAIMVSAGAFFTFGAKGQLVDYSEFLKGLYILEAFTGLVSLGTFVTVLANYWFQEK